MRATSAVLVLPLLLLTPACLIIDGGDGSGGDGLETSSGDGDGDPSTSGDGDGDPSTGDGDGDPSTSGDGDGDPSTSGDGDGDPSTGDGDGDGDTGCTAEGAEIVALVNAYRQDNGLPAIPLSPSLCTVGQLHVEDLAINAPHQQASCNLHSWSDQGDWSPCCYTSDHAQAECMWAKPGELTVYTGNGYENAYGGGGVATPSGAVDGWKSSPGHNDVMLNQGIWTGYPWGAVGAGLYQGYAVLWFGVEADPAAD